MESKIKKIIEESKKYGWILEPYAKQLLSWYEIDTPSHIFSSNFEEIKNFINKIGFPVVCKVVSPEIVHKSDAGGVIVGINNLDTLENSFKKLMELKGAIGVIVEKMVNGKELIIGSKNDEQFGPIILTGMGGVGVEIYKDTSIRMAPLKENEIDVMLNELKCYPILKGYRGDKGINIEKLKKTILKFSEMVMDIEEYFESIDLNPVICNENNCFVADARIILKK